MLFRTLSQYVEKKVNLLRSLLLEDIDEKLLNLENGLTSKLESHNSKINDLYRLMALRKKELTELEDRLNKSATKIKEALS